jgi:uncharacterized MnhB-related membrane protein
MLLYALLIALALVCAIQAIRAERLLTSALWLAGVSAALSIVFYMMGAYTVAVIELSVGAGLVTVLFVFAINIAGEDLSFPPPFVPRPAAWVLVIAAVGLLGWSALPLPWSALPLPAAEVPAQESTFAAVLWGKRGLDVLVQIVLIFAGVLGLLGLLAETKAPLDQSVAQEVIARREDELAALQKRVVERERELV